ncbi:uncharacterized protein RHIMIDRAFT_273838, partial [Rhizopus microsporus ATCC 52813]
MNSRGATRSLGGTLFDARGIVHDKLDGNTPIKTPLFVRATVLKSISHVTRSSFHTELDHYQRHLR